MFAELTAWFKEGKLKEPPIQKRKIEEFSDAITATFTSGSPKQAFVFDDE